MGARGPKARNSSNAGPSPAAGLAADVEPCSDLSRGALAEFRRLASVLEALGTLSRVDLAVVTEAARMKELLDRAHGLVDLTDPSSIKVINVLTTQRRGLLRELGLTLQPSRSVVRTNARPAEESDDPVRKHLKIRG